MIGDQVSDFNDKQIITSKNVKKNYFIFVKKTNCINYIYLFIFYNYKKTTKIQLRNLIKEPNLRKNSWCRCNSSWFKN